jgi:hypothetical protein
LKKISVKSYVLVILLTFLALVVVYHFLFPLSFAYGANDVTVKVHTVVPNAPTVMRIYQTSPLTAQDIDNLENLFFSPTETPSVDTDTPEIKKLSLGSRELIIEKQTGAYDYTNYSIWDQTTPVNIDTNTATAISNQYMIQKGLLDSFTFIRNTGRVIEESPTDTVTTAFNVNYGKSIDFGNGVIQGEGPGAKVFVSIGKNNQVGMIMNNFPKMSVIGTTQTISGSMALEKLKLAPDNFNEINIAYNQIDINAVTVAYFIPPTPEPTTIEPVYIFTGTVTDGVRVEDFYQIVPAIAQTNIDMLKQNLPIRGDYGGEAFHPSGHAGLNFSPGAFSGEMEVEINQVDPANYPSPPGKVQYSSLYNFSSNKSFSKATLSIKLNSGFDPSVGNLYRWNGSGWDKVSTQKAIDSKLGVISVQVSHLSTYGVFGPSIPPTGFERKNAILLAGILIATGMLIILFQPKKRFINIFILVIVCSLVNITITAPILAVPEVWSSGVRINNNDYGCRGGGIRGGDNANYADRNSDDFYGELINNAGFSGSSKKKNNNRALAMHWEDGTDYDYLEKVDIAFFNGHGAALSSGESGIHFNNDGGDCNCGAYTSELEWGNHSSHDLEVVALKACEVMPGGRGAALKDWLHIFSNIHQIMGFRTNVKSVKKFGDYFAKYMDGSIATKPVWTAWQKAGIKTQWGFNSVVAAMIYVSASGYNAKWDYLAGMGTQAADKSSASASDISYIAASVH